MSAKNPNDPSVPNAIELDAAINTVQNALRVIPWLQKSFHRARIFNDARDGYKPKVYQGTREYFEVLHNDFLSAHSFCYVTGPHQSIDYEAGFEGYYQVPVSLFVLGDLEKIDSSKDYIYTEELKADVLEVLRNDQTVSVIEILDDDPNTIFSEFGRNDKHRELLMYPKFALRLNIELTYQESCVVE